MKKRTRSLVVRLVLTLSLLVIAAAGPGGATRAIADESADRHSNNVSHPAKSGRHYPAGRHPWPSGIGEEWPAGLKGPFPVRSIERVDINSWDGTRLSGWLWMPDLPPKTRAPVVIWSGPYHAGLDPAGRDPDETRVGPHASAVPVERLVAEGYAVALMSVRGSGESGGCLDLFGEKEQRDQAFLAEWFGGRLPHGSRSPASEWSNGRVGMIGLSYDGTTPWQAAVRNPKALKAIVAMSGVGDFYLNYATPQGSMYAATSGVAPYGFAIFSAHPPIYRTVEEEPVGASRWLQIAPERICDDVLHQNATSVQDPLVDDRDESFYDERRLTDHFSDVRAAALITAGFFDIQALNQSIDAIGWPLLTKAPKTMVMGQWGHAAPTFEGWTDRVVAWFDFWLKGVGDPPASLGTVEYDAQGRTPCLDWPCSVAPAWPPTGVREALYLGDEGLAPNAVASGSTSFVAAVRPAGDLTPCSVGPGAATFLTPKLQSSAMVAGAPVAFLRLRSDQPGGVISARLWDLGRGSPCTGEGDISEARLIASGAADLRFHAGTFSGSNFPTGDTAGVRIDMSNTGWFVPAGNRLALVVSGPDPASIIPNGVTQYAPQISIEFEGGTGASQIVLPLADGSVGGVEPAFEFPPRPFLPDDNDNDGDENREPLRLLGGRAGGR